MAEDLCKISSMAISNSPVEETRHLIKGYSYFLVKNPLLIKKGGNKKGR